MRDLVVRPLNKDDYQSTRYVGEHLFVAAPYQYNAIVEALLAASLAFAVGIELNGSDCLAYGFHERVNGEM